MDKTASFFGGFILGAAIGAIVAAFMAPEAGAELQATIRNRFDQVVAEGQRVAAERRAELEAQFAQAKRFQRPASTSQMGM